MSDWFLELPIAALEDLTKGRELTFTVEPGVLLHMRVYPAEVKQFQAHVRRSLLHFLPVGGTKH